VRAINPYSKYDRNNTGVEADVKASAPDALKAALRFAGEKLYVKHAGARASGFNYWRRDWRWQSKSRLLDDG
jgi:hypothetical protein